MELLRLILPINLRKDLENDELTQIQLDRIRAQTVKISKHKLGKTQKTQEKFNEKKRRKIQI